MESKLQEPARFKDIAGAVILGGASSRMGQDKAQLEVDSIPMARRTAELLGRFFQDVILVGGAPPQGTPGRFVPDPEGPACPLRGLVGALDAAEAGDVVVVATDLPLLNAEAIGLLAAWPEAQAVVPETQHGLQPLCARYQRDSVLETARRRLQKGDLSLQGLLEAVETQKVDAESWAAVDPEGIILTNVNTPEDLEQVQVRLR